MKITSCAANRKEKGREQHLARSPRRVATRHHSRAARGTIGRHRDRRRSFPAFRRRQRARRRFGAADRRSGAGERSAGVGRSANARTQGRGDIRQVAFVLLGGIDTPGGRFPREEAARSPTCPLCRGPVRDGDRAVQCPGCGRWFHQTDAAEGKPAKPCWTYAPTCRFCNHPTALGGEHGWRPEMEEANGR